MQLTKDQELTVLWSMLHEPGDGVAREIFDSPYPLTSFPIELTMNQKRIQDAMRAGARFPDEIAAESGLSLASVLEELKPA